MAEHPQVLSNNRNYTPNNRLISYKQHGTLDHSNPDICSHCPLDSTKYLPEPHDAPVEVHSTRERGMMGRSGWPVTHIGGGPRKGVDPGVTIVGDGVRFFVTQ
ncbi:hypothetical protein NPIL_36831 [Nephila pilipes]|uniref:Uncharacterized protein n=1 Tax=Nephila pilipes TaxID=299642 RepID=A0A8X6NVA0_NEPPI|nr:hypothetical protein NPIL_36831 [Nephila pilipes]